LTDPSRQVKAKSALTQAAQAAQAAQASQGAEEAQEAPARRGVGRPPKRLSGAVAAKNSDQW
jgi:hypothetical protein